MQNCIGEKLKTMRERQKLTSTELSKRSGVPISTICDIEKSRAKSPTVDTIEKLSVALRISPVYFFNFKLENLPDGLQEILLAKDFLPYLDLIKKAYYEQIPINVIDTFFTSLINSYEHNN